MTSPSPKINTRPILISVRNAQKVYRMGEVDVLALRDATLDIHEGDFFVVRGPSGSGKSTLLNLIGGMDRPTAGIIPPTAYSTKSKTGAKTLNPS